MNGSLHVTKIKFLEVLRDAADKTEFKVLVQNQKQIFVRQLEI
jgi:hypothetical protein